MKNKKRSPIKNKPLRNPAQSLEKLRSDILDDKLLPLIMMAAMMLVLTTMEWIRYFNPRPPNPVIWTVVTFIFVIYVGWRFWKFWPELKNINLGIEGEKAVGQFLEKFRVSGYHVFHDLQGDGFNLDHVIIGPAGAFSIETKTLSKIKNDAKLQFDGENITVDGNLLVRNPVRQACAQANWLEGVLHDCSGEKVQVWPIVLFPGWFIEHKPRALNQIWVLEPKALETFLSNKKEVLSKEKIDFLSSNLARFLRGQ